ncbi:thiamine pyrophosphate-binding protein [Dactylosporangium fulvum]|uniref:Thiamine pyrophosphate-binding protein n=1 Tax=Dactylosporangium fulvum TaxID=53359 RepID=A0ABY5VSB3_9ACTN|nr:thiamine pyrophosphate-binding protein [Dactylosporangium fulvum]UWP80097.1 thiamine pyrophosphate-binding protein [Dactylosporangium fulvum]
MKAYEAVAAALAGEVGRPVFTLMSDDTAKLLVALHDRGAPLIATRHESTAVGAADGFWRSTATVGVAVVGKGPGLTNALNALLTAAKAGSGVLVVTGGSASGERGRIEAHQGTGKYIEQSAMLRALGVQALRVDEPQRLSQTVSEALIQAARGATVVLEIASDVLNSAEVAPITGEPVPAEQPAVAEAEIAELCEVLTAEGAANRVVLLAGRGAVRSGAGPLLASLADRLGAALATTLPARGLFHGHPRDVGVVGTYATPAATDLVSRADLVLAFGASLNQFTTYKGSIFGRAHLVQIDTDLRAFGRHTAVEMEIRGDAAATARRLLDELPIGGKRGYPTRADGNLVENPPIRFTDRSTQGSLDPRTVMAALDAALPADRTVVIEPGNHSAFSLPALAVTAPDRFIAPWEYSSIGTGLGPAIGAAVAHPSRTTVLCVGDGGWTMTSNDLDTAVRHRLPLVIVVSDDGGFGSEAHYLRLHGLPADLAYYANPSFVQAARAIGAAGLDVSTPDDVQRLPAMVGRHLGDGPVLLHCRMDPQARGDWIDFAFGPAVPVATGAR